MHIETTCWILNKMNTPKCSVNLWCKCEDCEKYWESLEKNPVDCDVETTNFELEKELDLIFCVERI